MSYADLRPGHGSNLQPGHNNIDLEKDLEELPDKVAEALKEWRIATQEKKKAAALIYAELRGSNPDMQSIEIKHRIELSEVYDQASLKEIIAESEYSRLENKLLAAKKLAGLRTAY